MKKIIFKIKSSKGFGLLEAIIAMGIVVIIATTVVTTLIFSLSTNRLAAEQARAILMAQEGIEAARSIHHRGYGNLTTGDHGIDRSAGFWIFLFSSDSNGQYERTVTVESVNRDGSGNIVESGGSADGDTRKVISEVEWDFTSTKKNTVTIETYLSNWKKEIAPPPP